ncbi:MAG: hypothetical protein HDR26_10800 [Lachnospiraceae bacterium]|nr:hypothetical protein [Lachnospiraceae bacterium]
MDYRHRVVPFYMTYQTPWFIREEDNILRDLEYMQQMYPAQAKKYQKRIAEIVDKMDYDGSIIYDEYPDKWQLYRLAQSILEIIKREECGEEAGENDPPEKWEWIGDMIQLLLYYEIYRRRHCSRKGFLKF